MMKTSRWQEGIAFEIFPSVIGFHHQRISRHTIRIYTRRCVDWDMVGTQEWSRVVVRSKIPGTGKSLNFGASTGLGAAGHVHNRRLVI